MSEWLYVPLTIHLENKNHSHQASKAPQLTALGGIYLLNSYTNNYYILAASTVQHPEKYSYRFTCPLLISQTTIEWVSLMLCDIKYLHDEPATGGKFSAFIDGITMNDQFEFQPFGKDYISVLSLKLSSSVESPTPFFDHNQLTGISFLTREAVEVPSRVVIQCCPFSLTNVAIFSSYKMFGSINYSVNGLGYLSDIKYLDDTIGGVVNLEKNYKNLSPEKARESVGLVCGNLSKVNGDGDLLVILSWSKIFQLVPYKDLIQSQSTLLRPQLQIAESKSEDFKTKSADPINSCVRISVSSTAGHFWGSGIVLLEDTIITNLHVLRLDEMLDIHVLFPNNPSLSLRMNDFTFEPTPLLGFDLCFMKLKNPSRIKLPLPVKMVNNFSKPLKVGQMVKSIGHGLFYSKNLTELKPFHSEGVLNSLISIDLDGSVNEDLSLLLVSASCWNGSSGGGLFNEANELIGIMTSNGKLSTGEILPNFTLGIPINIIEKSYFMLSNGLDPIDVKQQIDDLWSLKNTHNNVMVDHLSQHKL
jgi:S1-C subfamily serine protease